MNMFYNEDCVSGAKKYITDGSIDLLVCDPPFGIKETRFDSMYNRKKESVIDGYRESPDDYYSFTLGWVEQAKRVLKNDGSMYIVSSWTNIHHIRRVIEELDMKLINEIIWKYNFGVFTKKKFVSSHYNISYVAKNKKAKPTFNTDCRFSSSDRTPNKRSIRYQDMEDVWVINKEYRPGETKTTNKLPEKLVEKMIQYSSNPGNTVCDFFLGNFTTAIVAAKLGRIPCGFEINSNHFEDFVDLVNTHTKKPKGLELFE